MDDEKKWSGDEPQKDTAPPEATKPSVRYEENDNWEFEAQAPTLDDNFLADDQFEIQMPAEKPRPAESVPAAPAANSGEKQVTVRTAPLKIALFCLLFAAVVAVLAVLGVRYYTVPNGKEGEMLNPGGTALTVGETKVSLGAYNYYYSRIVQNYLNYANYGYYDLDSTKDYSKQYVTNSDGEKITWLQMFKDKTVDQIQYVTSYYEAGQAAGITLTADQKKSIKEQMDSLKSSASEANQSLDDYIEKEFGDYCTAATLETVQEQAYIAENYYRHTLTRSNISDAEYNAFYKEHSKDYYNCAFAFIEMTYDTTSAETKAASVKKAKEYLTKIHSVKDMKKMIPTVCADLIKRYVAGGYFENEAKAVDGLSEYVENTMTAKDTSYGKETTQWLFNDSTKVGDTTYYCDEENGFIYLFIKTGTPKLDETSVYSVRHLLVTPGDNSKDSSTSSTEKKYTKKEWAAAKEKAEKLLAQYNKTDKTEYDFAMLAEENSADTNSTSAGGQGVFGGMIEGTKKGAMVPEFEKWAMDDSRKYGDVAIVKSKYGYHIMYFIDKCPQYQYNCKKDILSDRETQMVDGCAVKEHKTAMKKAAQAKLEESTTAGSSVTSGNTGSSAASGTTGE